MSEALPEGVGEVVEPVVEPAAEPAWSGVSSEEWAQTQQTLQQQQEYIAAIAQAITPQEGPRQIDPFSPDIPFQDQLDAYLNERLAGYDAFQAQAAVERGEAQANEMLGTIVARDGAFLFEGSQQKARELANTYFASVAQQHGATPQSAQLALEQAAKDVREWETAVGKAYYERELNQIRGITGAPQEAGAAGQQGATQQHTVAPGGPYGVLKKYTGQNY